MRMRHLVTLALVFLVTVACSKKDSPTTDDSTDQYESEISGVVVTKAGSPLNGVNVTSQKSGTTVTSDESGKFNLADLGAGEHRLDFHKEGYEPSSLPVTLTLLEKKALTSSVQLDYKYVTITGTVTKNGSPARLPGVTVQDQNASVIADTAGKFILDEVVPGVLEIYSVLDDEGYGTTTITTVADTTYDISIDIDKFGGKIIGRVVDASGEVVPDAQVEITNFLVDTTNNYGVFEFNHLPSKIPHTLTITKGVLKQALSGLTVLEHGELDVGDLMLLAEKKDTTTSPIKMINGEYAFTLGEQDSITLVAYYGLNKNAYVMNKYDWVYSVDGVKKSVETHFPNLTLPTSLWTTVGVDTVFVRATAIRTDIITEGTVSQILSDTTFSNLGIITVNRTAPNNPAQFTVVPVDTTLKVGDNYSVALTATDSDDDSLIYSLESGSANGVTFNGSTVYFAPIKADTFAISVSVTDGKLVNGQGVKQYANWTISAWMPDTVVVKDTLHAWAYDTVATEVKVALENKDTTVTTTTSEIGTDTFTAWDTTKVLGDVITIDTTTGVFTDTTVLSTVVDTLKYIAPATITLTPSEITAPTATITLSTVGMKETITSLYIELTGATVDAVTLVNADANIEKLTTDSSIMLLVMPGETGFVGAVDIATVSLAGLVAGTPVTVTQIVAKDENDRVIPLIDIPSVEVK